jgi:hypothetical protein
MAEETKIDQKLEELSLSQLKDEVVKLGMSKEDADKFTSKPPLIVTIKNIKDAKEVKRVKTLNEPPNPKEEKLITKVWQSKKDKMRDHLEKQPKVTFFIPLAEGGTEKPGVVRTVLVNGKKEYLHVSGAVEWRCFNGYRVCIPKGVFTEIPIQVANKLKEAMLPTEAEQKLSLDRIDPETGRSIKEGMYHG